VESIQKGPIDAARFPDELNKFEGEKSGLYILWGKDNHKVLYIGISIDIPNRIYGHIGTNFAWTRPGSTASFPNCTLVWDKLSGEAKKILLNANFYITAFILKPPEISRLIESFFLFYSFKHKCWPEGNIDF
jgi:hypothetical protein